MRNMLKIFVILALVFSLVGCATLTLPEDADSAAKKAALCSDAQIALEVAEAALADEDLDEDAARAYRISKLVAEIAIRNYCVGAPIK